MTDCTCTNFPSSLGFITFGNGIVADNDNNSNGVPDIRFGGSGGGEGVGSTRATGGANEYGLDLYTGYAQRLSITNGGNVGVGTTAPETSLHVAGNAMAAGANSRLTLGRNDGSDPTSSKTWHLDNNGNDLRVFQQPTLNSSGTVYLIVKDGGNVGLGTTSPAQLLHLYGGNAMLQSNQVNPVVGGYSSIMLSTNAYGDALLNFGTASTGAFLVDQAGTQVLGVSQFGLFMGPAGPTNRKIADGNGCYYA